MQCQALLIRQFLEKQANYKFYNFYLFFQLELLCNESAIVTASHAAFPSSIPGCLVVLNFSQRLELGVVGRSIVASSYPKNIIQNATATTAHSGSTDYWPHVHFADKGERSSSHFRDDVTITCSSTGTNITTTINSMAYGTRRLNDAFTRTLQ